MNMRSCRMMALALLPSILLAAEPPANGAPPVTQSRSTTAGVEVSAPSATDPLDSGNRSLARAMDLRGDAVRGVVRAIAATQSDANFRVPPAERQKVDLAAPLKVGNPLPQPEPAPQVPERPQPPKPCNGFWSCGLETLLGLHDHDFDDEQEYARQERNRLMNQGSFTDKSGCEACNSPADPNLKLRDPGGKGAPIRP